MDGDVGIRLEEGASMRVLPYSMVELMSASDTIFGEGKMKKCACCGTKESDTREGLKMCSKCRSIFYCGRVDYLRLKEYFAHLSSCSCLVHHRDARYKLGQRCIKSTVR